MGSLAGLLLPAFRLGPVAFSLLQAPRTATDNQSVAALNKELLNDLLFNR